MEELHATRQRSIGEANARGLLAGGLFTLTEHPVDDVNREYLVVSLEGHIRSHEIESGTADTGPVFRCQFTAIEGEKTFRASRSRRLSRARRRRRSSANRAGNHDRRVRAREAQLSLGSQESEERRELVFRARWQIWAGTKWGGMHIPRIGQEVIVELLEGDPDRPIVTGRVYNKDNSSRVRSATESDAERHQEPLHTRRGEINFNEIRFEDKKGAELFFMQVEKDHTTEVKNNQSTNVVKNRSASVGGSDSVSVGGDRSVSVTGNLTVTVEGGQSKLTVTGKHNVDATQTIEVQAPTHIKLTVGSSSVLIQPTMITLKAGSGAKLVLDTNATLTSNDGSELKLDPNASLTSKGKAQVMLNADALTKSSGGSQLKLDGAAKLTSGANVEVGGKKGSLAGADAGKLALEAAAPRSRGPRSPAPARV